MAAKLGMTNAELIDSINSDLGNVVTLSGDQTIGGIKQFQALKLQKQDTDLEGGQLEFEKADNDTMNLMYIDRYNGQFRFIGKPNDTTNNITLVVNVKDNLVYLKTPGVSASNEEAINANWFNQKIQVVSALPANPDANVYYFVTG